MLQFKPLAESDMDTVKPYLDQQQYRSCDYTVGGIYLWEKVFCPEYCIDKDMLFFKVKCPFRGLFFMFPVGFGDKIEALRSIAQYAASEQLPLMMTAVPLEELFRIFQVFGADIQIHRERDTADYLYAASDLSCFPGKKYHGQRNHAAFFAHTYGDYRYCTVTPEDIPALRRFLHLKYTVDEHAGTMEQADFAISYNIIERFRDFGMQGGCLKNSQGDIAGFAFGERQGDTLYVHVEKADRNLRGAYQTIVQQFSAHMCTDEIRFINREDDAGDPGLRISKLSYHPVSLAEKYTVTVS